MTKEEILKSVADDFMMGDFRGLGDSGVLFGSEDTFGPALRLAVEIFCCDLHELNPEFGGNFYTQDGFLIPFVHEPRHLLIKADADCGYLKVKSDLGGALVWCAALNKAARHWVNKKNEDRAKLCWDMMRDLLRELPVHKSFKENITKLEEWSDILKNQIPNL